MSSIKYGNQQVWSDTTKITNPSLILNDNGIMRYTPLLSGSNNGTAEYGDYEYTLGGLKVGNKRAAISRKLVIVTCSASFRMRCELEVKNVVVGYDGYGNPITGKRYYSREYIDNVSSSVSHDIRLIGFNVNGTLRSSGLIWESYSTNSIFPGIFPGVFPSATFSVQAVFENSKGQRYYSNTISRASYGSSYSNLEGWYTVRARVHI